MFSFFKKKQPFSVRIKEYDSVRLIAGMEITTCLKSMKKDVAQLQKKMQQKQGNFHELSNPSGTMVISKTPDENGNFSYFLGAWVDSEEQEPPFIVKQLQPGLYAHIQVDFSVPANLALNMAKAKHYFFEKWLPNSGYKVADGIDSIELYDRRTNIGLPSMELIFPLEKK